MADKKKNLMSPIFDAPEEVQRIVQRVLQLEKENLYRTRAHGLKDEVVRIVKDEIK